MTTPSTAYGPPLPGRIAWPRRGARGAYGFHRSATHTHQGIDLRAPQGTPWLAVASGTIADVRTGPTAPGDHGYRGYGRVVVLDTGADATPRYWLYAHGSDVAVAPGDRVTRGQVLGHVGSSQFTATDPQLEGRMRPHLHLEAATRAYPMGSEAPWRVDPLPLLRGGGAAPPDQLASNSPSAPSSPSGPTSNTSALRAEMMRRISRTDLAVTRSARDMRSVGAPQAAADALISAWSEARRVILAAARTVSSTLESLRSTVDAWLAELARIAELARAAMPDMAAAIDELVRRLRAIWRAGIDWSTGLVAAAAGGSALLLLGLLWAVSRR